MSRKLNKQGFPEETAVVYDRHGFPRQGQFIRATDDGCALYYFGGDFIVGDGTEAELYPEMAMDAEALADYFSEDGWTAKRPRRSKSSVRRNPAGRQRKSWTLNNTRVSTWFERDRAHVFLESKTSGKTLLEFRDDDVAQLVEDGFLDPRNWHGSMLEYYKYLKG
jgi:hypothetical protein